MKSSGSTKFIYLPLANVTPKFLALATPPLFLLITFILESNFENFSIIFKVLSVEPSFIIIISISFNV